MQPLSSGTNSVCNTEMFSCLARLCILPESGLAAILLKRRYVCKRIACFDNFLSPQRVLCPGPAQPIRFSGISGPVLVIRFLYAGASRSLLQE